MAGKELKHTECHQDIIGESPNGWSLLDLRAWLFPQIFVAQTCPYVQLFSFLYYFGRLITETSGFSEVCLPSQNQNETTKTLLLLTAFLPDEL